MPRRKKQFKFPEQRRVVATVPHPLTFFYEIFDGGELAAAEGEPEIRWWRNDNPGDVFDIITRAELQKRLDGAAMCQVRVVDHLPGFCDEMEKCPDHLGYY